MLVLVHREFNQYTDDRACTVCLRPYLWLEKSHIKMPPAAHNHNGTFHGATSQIFHGNYAQSNANYFSWMLFWCAVYVCKYTFHCQGPFHLTTGLCIKWNRCASTDEYARNGAWRRFKLKINSGKAVKPTPISFLNCYDAIFIIIIVSF